jgi:tRNA-splicing ligase RtcB
MGGGNHFVEIQYVDKILDGTTAHAWGLRPGMVTVMAHTGAVSIGHLSGGYFRDVVRSIYPAGLKHPSNGIFILPEGERHRSASLLFWDAVHNAGNFAFANRMFLALTSLAGLRQVCGDCDFPLLYDAPPNFLWRDSKHGEEIVLHRKGACPALGFDDMVETYFACYGEPVLVPG